jgi:carboxyl-terminal processing protease
MLYIIKQRLYRFPKITVFLLLLCLTLIFSCTQEIQPDDEADKQIITTSFVGYFDAFWAGMNRNYVFWDIDTTDWDNVYKVYRPKFDSLKIGKPADEKQAGVYFRKMLAGLSDSHYNIQFPTFLGMAQNDTTIKGLYIRGNTFSPSLYRKAQNPNFYLGPFDRSTPDLYATLDYEKYLDADSKYQVLSPDPAGGVKNDFLITGTINHEVLYLKFNQFFLYQRYSYDAKYREVLNTFFKLLKESPKNGIKGLIIDVRQNGGGDLRDLNFLIGRLVEKPTLIGYQHYKNGDNRLDYTPWLPFYVKPPLELDPSPQNAAVPVVVLADAHSVSMAEITTMAVKAISTKNKFVGETTWGAMGALTSKDILTGGQFSTGGLSFTYTSSAATVNKNYKSYEGKGITPDVSVRFDAEALANGVDKQLEAAIRILN